jgi:2-polyprenyl-3-methyl-5-hydroxy-6-metoxy-1,4-benzoquinol methylase
MRTASSEFPVSSDASFTCPVCGSIRNEPTYPRYVRCSTCHLLRNEPFPSSEEIAAYYQQKASSGNYSDAIAVFDAQRADTYRRSLSRLLTLMPGGLQGKSVLDVGCFTGLSLDVLKQLGGEAYGLEYQPEAAAIANSRHPGHVCVGDICSAPDFARPFDAVTMTDVIEHVPDPARALRTVTHLLHDDGWLLLTTPDTGSLMARCLRSAWPSLCPIHHLHLFNRANLARLLQTCGFEVARACSLWKWYSLEYINWIMPNFNPSLARVCSFVPKYLQRFVLPLNGGEMLIVARKRKPALARAA